MSREAIDVKSSASDEGATFVDGWSSPEGAIATLTTAENVTLKLLPRASSGATSDFAPPPNDVLFCAAHRGSSKIVGGGEVARVSIELRELSWGLGATPFPKTVAEILIQLTSNKQLSFAGSVADDRRAALEMTGTLARALADFLGVPLEGLPEDRDVTSSKPSSNLGARAVRRISLGFEGDHLVLRDHEGRGPREGAARYQTIALSCFVPALANAAGFAWFLRAYLADSTTGIGYVLAPLALALVLGVAALAFFSIARYARAYSANSTALAWFHDDRVVVAPWVSRDGAVDTRPEGRLGAAIRTAEISGALASERDGRYAVVLDTAHGPMEIFESADRELVDHFVKVVERAVRSVASPQKKRTALMRAHERREKVSSDRDANA